MDKLSKAVHEQIRDIQTAKKSVQPRRTGRNSQLAVKTLEKSWCPGERDALNVENQL